MNGVRKKIKRRKVLAAGNIRRRGGNVREEVILKKRKVMQCHLYLLFNNECGKTKSRHTNTQLIKLLFHGLLGNVCIGTGFILYLLGKVFFHEKLAQRLNRQNLKGEKYD